MVSFLLIGTKLIFAQSGELHSFELDNNTSLNSSFVDMFSKSRTSYLHRGEKGSVGVLLKIDNKLRKLKTGKEVSLIEDHFIIYKRYNEDDLFVDNENYFYISADRDGLYKVKFDEFR